jgi:hypothetical protein
LNDRGIDFDQMDEKKDTIKQQIKQEHTEAMKQEPSSLFTLDKSINKEDLIKVS